jgi:GTP-binding protein Era
MPIQYQNEISEAALEALNLNTTTLESYGRLMKEAVQAVLNLVDFPEDYEPDLSLSLVDAEEIKALNLENRDLDQVTDVLSFPQLEMDRAKFLDDISPVDAYPAPDTSDKAFYLPLGDIVICLPRALEQAEEYGHGIDRELAFLACHGALHLIGYDHTRSKEEEKVMFDLQEKILEGLGQARIKSGFVSIVGRPNAGKSTLLNCLMGSELAITSRKAQTTRNNIRTVLDDGQSQIIFVDTPGIHRSKNKLDRFMVDSAWQAVEGADVVLLLVDPERNKITEVEEVCCRKAEENDIPVLLLLTKTDKIEKEKLLPVMAKYSAFYPFKEIIPISSMTRDNIDLLLEKIREYLPYGPRYYSEDAYTDQTERSLATEFIREQVLHYTHQEVPHHAAVVIDSFEEKEDEDGNRNLVVIGASIIVDKESHKGIIIGKGGQMLKRIGASARIKIEEMLDCKVYLDLHVKVRSDWQNRENILKELGYQQAQDLSGPGIQ